ncbi:unnamed protein product [Bursaphelenchus xylophilus]|nr:unnamed protein product [Bursaphelenchus xylophilus]CAG9118832.1 unnamed protein product [Bursaphelenchus xylophilus]
MDENRTLALNATLAAKVADAEAQQYVLQLWISVSQFLWWMILVISGLTVPTLVYALYTMLTKYKKSNYFHFLAPMIILDLINLTTVICNLFSDSYKFMNGSFMCRLTAFLTNATMCCVNWLWVMMFTQRFAHIFFSIHRSKKGRLLFLTDSKKLLTFTIVMSLMTQIWAPMVMTEHRIPSTGDNMEATYCSVDLTLINPELYKWIAAAESLWTYLVPFVITVLTDFAVLMFTRESKWFTTISTQSVAAKSRMSSIPVSIKIQSEEGMKAAHRRRRQAIRRCLVLATTQLLLNMPNYVLQVVDEFTGLRGKNGDMAIMYLYADAFLYGLYMLQFPILAVFVRLLHSNYKSRSKNRSTRRTQTNTETVTVELTRHTNGSIDSTARRESQICVCTETSLA